MKLNQLFAASVFTLLSSHWAAAQTTIRIVASNGDRTATQTAISKLLAPGWTFRGVDGSATSANLSVATGTNFGAWHGTYAGNAVVIKTSYAGALAGIAAVAGNTQQRFVVSNGTGTGAVPNPLNGTVEGTDYELGTASFGFSTNFQSTSPFNGDYLGVNYLPLTEDVVGVSPLGFYASPGFPAGSANITTQQAQLLYTGGSLPLALFTGDFAADANKTVWAIGRNTDAGQRFAAYSEVGLGKTALVKVWKSNYGTPPTTTSGITYGGTINSHDLWPAETFSGIFSPLGSGGWTSGAILAQYLTVALGPDAYKGKYFDEDTQSIQFTYPNATAGYYIGYITPGDAANRVLGGNGVVPVVNRGVALSYNGVPLTNANVQNGQYTAWLYNRMLRPQGGVVGSVPATFSEALRIQIKTVDAPSGGGLFDDANFKVKRTTDGGLVTPK